MNGKNKLFLINLLGKFRLGVSTGWVGSDLTFTRHPIRLVRLRFSEPETDRDKSIKNHQQFGDSDRSN